jgi:hypothetical protein
MVVFVLQYSSMHMKNMRRCYNQCVHGLVCATCSAVWARSATCSSSILWLAALSAFLSTSTLQPAGQPGREAARATRAAVQATRRRYKAGGLLIAAIDRLTQLGSYRAPGTN